MFLKAEYILAISDCVWTFQDVCQELQSFKAGIFTGWQVQKPWSHLYWLNDLLCSSFRVSNLLLNFLHSSFAGAAPTTAAGSATANVGAAALPFAAAGHRPGLGCHRYRLLGDPESSRAAVAHASAMRLPYPALALHATQYQLRRQLHCMIGLNDSNVVAVSTVLAYAKFVLGINQDSLKISLLSDIRPS